MTAKYLGRKVKQELTFKEEGTFQSMYAAESWLRVNGYSHGSTCKDRSNGSGLRVAIKKGEYDLPEKWIHFEKEDKESVDGVMLSNDFREGSVTVLIFEPKK